MQKKDQKLTEMQEHFKRQEGKLKQCEVHIEKLSKQCFAMNEFKQKVHELAKENELMRSKLRFVELNGGMQTTGSIGMTRMPSTTTQMNGANLGMEDEPGEEFNNTYLDQLKSEGSQLSLDKHDVYSADELQKRNSMYPQHMRASYAVIDMDRNITEQEIKVRNSFQRILKWNETFFLQSGGSFFDDSQTALLQNGPSRKKQSTSYKRPGPPTPSKSAGRLSIGGASDINYTNVLKDSTNMEKKTPVGRLRGIFSSNSKLKDEVRSYLHLINLSTLAMWRQCESDLHYRLAILTNIPGFTGK